MRSKKQKKRDQLNASITAVRVAKYLHTLGYKIRVFQVSSGGRTLYVKAIRPGDRLTVRISDHPPTLEPPSPNPSRFNRRRISKLLSFYHAVAYERIRSAVITHHLSRSTKHRMTEPS